MEPIVGRKQDNLAKSLELIGSAADSGARLIVLPELCNSGYVFDTREEAFGLAETLPQGDTCATWMRIAAERRLYLVAGIAECEGQALYNSAVVIGPEGYIGKFRKVHLWNE